MTTMQKALRQLIANDAYAMTFQSMGQYRTALLKYVDGLFEGAQPYATGGILPGGLHLVGEGPFIAPALAAQSQGAQAAYWPHGSTEVACSDCGLTMGESRLLHGIKRGDVSLATQQAAALGALLEILRDVHDTLASQADSDIDHFEDDDEEREGAPAQYAARKVMEIIGMLKAVPSPLDTPEAPKGGIA